MALADAFGADAPYDPGQGVDYLARQVFLDDVQESHSVDPGRLSDVLAGRMDRKTRHIDKNPSGVEPPSVIDLFWKIATSSTALCFDAVVPLAALVVGFFPLV